MARRTPAFPAPETSPAPMTFTEITTPTPALPAPETSETPTTETPTTETPTPTPAATRTDRIEIRISFFTDLLPFLRETGDPTLLALFPRMKIGPTYSGIRMNRKEIRKIIGIMTRIQTQTTDQTNPQITWQDREEERKSTLRRIDILIRKLSKGIEDLDRLETIRH
jgi:hypothetical protein